MIQQVMVILWDGNTSKYSDGVEPIVYACSMSSSMSNAPIDFVFAMLLFFKIKMLLILQPLVYLVL